MRVAIGHYLISALDAGAKALRLISALDAGAKALRWRAEHGGCEDEHQCEAWRAFADMLDDVVVRGTLAESESSGEGGSVLLAQAASGGKQLTPDATNPAIPCSDCWRWFRTAAELDEHYSKAHG